MTTYGLQKNVVFLKNLKGQFYPPYIRVFKVLDLMQSCQNLEQPSFRYHTARLLIRELKLLLLIFLWFLIMHFLTLLLDTKLRERITYIKCNSHLWHLEVCMSLFSYSFCVSIFVRVWWLVFQGRWCLSLVWPEVGIFR